MCLKRFPGMRLVLAILLLALVFPGYALAEPEPVSLTAAPLSKLAVTIAPGEQTELDVVYTFPTGATEGYGWTASNGTVVKITPNPEGGASCTVEGLKDGKSYVSVVSESGKTLSRCLVTVRTVKVKAVSLNKRTLTMHPGTTFDLKATVKPAGATYRSIQWRSTNEKAVKITNRADGSATIMAVGNGKASIVASSLVRKAVCSVTVKNLSVSAIKFSPNKRTVYLHSPTPVKVYPVVAPATAADTSVTLTSSDESVAEIADDGTLTLKKTGKTVITARSVNNKVAKCTVTVATRPIKSLKVTGAPEGPIDPGEEGVLSAAVTPGYAENRAVKWTSSEEGVVTVDPDTGAYRALSGGVAVIKATSVASPAVSAAYTMRVRGGAMRTITISAGGDAVIGGETRAKHATSPKFDQRFKNMISDPVLSDDPTATNGIAFQHVKRFFEGGDNIGILNLEVTFTGPKTKPNNKTFVFRGEPEYAQTILKNNGIDVVSLANNHTGDFGSAGYRDTMRALNAAGVYYCGPNVPTSRSIYTTENGVRVGFLGYVSKGASASRIRAQVKALKKKCDMVVVSYHWTDVKQFDYRMPNSKQRTLARAAINAGAKLVLGHHVHRVSGVEKYKDGYIAYDLANFMTNAIATQNRVGPYNPMGKQDFDSMIYQQKFNVFEDGYVEAADITIIPLSATSSKTVNNTMPRPFDPAREWDDYMRVINNINRFSINYRYSVPVG